MLDIRLIREKPDFVRKRLAARGGGDEAKIDDLLRVDVERRQTETALQQLNADRKRLSKEIGGKKARGEPTEELEQRVRGFGEEIGDLNAQATAAEEKQNDLLLRIANLPDESVPIGKDAAANRVVRNWGEKPRLTNPADHVTLGTKLNLLDMERAAKLSVELVKVTAPEKSYDELESLTANAERVLQLLGLHYRVVELCTGDLGFAAAKSYDIEVWSPGQDAYLEVSSCSNCEDFQARRMQLRFKDRDGKNRFCHTLNGSGMALPRLFAALIESYQQPDGSVLIPEKLQSYFGAEKINHE
jgi:seryl-tRNA synthetase